jgi:hypothetical protein
VIFCSRTILWYTFFERRSLLLRWSLLLLLLCGVSHAVGKVSAPEAELIPITRASVSNWQEKPQPFPYYKAYDGKIETSWGTGGSFVERGSEWITLYLDRPVFVTKISIAPGLQVPSVPNKSSFSFFTDNGRPRNIAATFSDGSEQNINLVDFRSEAEMGFQERNIRPTRTRWVRLQINSIYPGEDGGPATQDVGIAEIEIYGFDTLPTED